MERCFINLIVTGASYRFHRGSAHFVLIKNRHIHHHVTSLVHSNSLFAMQTSHFYSIREIEFSFICCCENVIKGIAASVAIVATTVCYLNTHFIFKYTLCVVIFSYEHRTLLEKIQCAEFPVRCFILSIVVVVCMQFERVKSKR